MDDATINYVSNRFKDAKFYVSCFNTIEEVDNKVLCDDDVIILYDTFHTDHTFFKDYMLVKKREGEHFIYYKDVINTLIQNNFIRDDTDNHFLESIGIYNQYKRNQNGLNVYCFHWGS